MKQLVIVIGVACFIFTACRKKETESSSLSGTWELTKISGQVIIDYPPGNGTKWKFTETNYEFYRNDTLRKSGTFTLVNDGSVSESVCLTIPANEYKQRIIYNSQSDSVKVFIQVSGNRLSMISGCYANDGGSTQEYIRQ